MVASLASPGDVWSPPTDAEARAVLAPPSGSLSHGFTSGGELRGARKLALKGKAWAFLTVVGDRGTHHGTSEMVALLQRVAAATREAHPGAKIGIGNISVAEGGKTRWHASHQTGRDVDLAFFARDKRGRPINPTAMTRYDAEGRAIGNPRQTFDVARNLTVVLELLRDEREQVQWIFVYDGLKQLLLAEAREQEVPAEEIERLELVLHQPSDSNPHDNHFHVRIFCSVEDRQHGCLERGPIWPWVDLGDDAFASRVAALTRVLLAENATQQRAAIAALGDIRAAAALPALAPMLHSSDDKTRRAALDTIRRIGSATAIPALLGALASTPDPTWARRLVASLYALRSSSLVALVTELVDEPVRFLADADLVDEVRETIEHTAARTLGRDGRKAAVPLLLRILASPAKRVRVEAEAALVRITNHRLGGQAGSKSAKKRQHSIAAWQRFWEAHRDETWLEWLLAGFGAAGVKLGDDPNAHESIEALIEATADAREHISHNAVRTIGLLTGHVQDPYARSRRNKRRHFRRWWELELTAGGESAPTSRD